MKKVLIIILLLGFILGIVLLLFKDYKPTALTLEEEPEEIINNSEEDPLSGVSTLADLRARSTNLECEIAYTDEGSPEASGTFYTKEGKIRADFTTTDPDLGETKYSLIDDGEMVYLWSEIEGEIYGVSVASEQANELETQKPISDDDRIQYDCREEVMIEDALFIPPSNIIFTPVGEANIEYGTIYEFEDQ